MRKRWHFSQHPKDLAAGGSPSTRQSWLTPLTAQPFWRATAPADSMHAINNSSPAFSSFFLNAYSIPSTPALE
jgi:hypothetical protein